MSAPRAMLLAIALACAGAPAMAQDATQSAAPATQGALAGEYHLEGVMETGSGLREGDTVELVVAEMGFPPQFPETQFDRMRLRVEGSNLVPAWPWDMDAFRKGEERGHYTRE